MSYLSKEAKKRQFLRKKVVPCSVKWFNHVCEYIQSVGGNIHFHSYLKEFDKNIGFDGFVEDRVKLISITCRVHGNYCTYVCDKSTGDVEEAKKGCNAGMHAYNCLVRMLKDKKEFVPRIVTEYDMKDGKNVYPFSASPMMYYNPEKNFTRTKAIGYDMNSAYSWAMLQPIPDTRELKTARILCWNPGTVKEGQIGFDSQGNLVYPGNEALYVFNLVPSPFEKFVDLYYNKKKKAKNPNERQRAKDVLNMAVGYLQRINPFIRACIIGRCNDYMYSLIDEYTLYCNTDSIVSTKKRKDLVIGEGLGEWKIEHNGLFAYNQYTYQWDMKAPKYRGIPNEWFKRGWDLLKDEIPHVGNMYEFNHEKLKLVRTKLEVIKNVD